MARARPAAAAVLLLLLGGCAGAARSTRDELAFTSLQARLAARAAALVGEKGPFEAGGARFNADCSGFVEAVYEFEGIPLRQLAARAAPTETSGVMALYRALDANGIVFGGGGEWPAPGDLVFFHDTYDRDRDGRDDDPFTHVGLVEYVGQGGTVVFFHRGGTGVVRAALSPDRPDVAKDADGTVRNSPLRDRRAPARAGGGLAGQLFSGYGRLDPSAVLRAGARP